MSEFLNKAAAEMNTKMAAADFDGTAKFEIPGEGSIMMDNSGARVGDGPADVTMTADAETFREIFEGELNPTSAFMTGKLSVDGDMGMAMKLASVLG
jgi:putative sterol carrier protein